MATNMKVFLFVVFSEPKGPERHFIQVRNLTVPEGEERASFSSVWPVALYASFLNVRCPSVQIIEGETHVFPECKTGAFDFKKDAESFVVLVMFEKAPPRAETRRGGANGLRGRMRHASRS